MPTCVAAGHRAAASANPRVLQLILERSNVREVLEGGGVRVLTDLMSLAHLHVKRATLTTATNVIEAAPGATDHGHKEWYYQVLTTQGVVLPGTHDTRSGTTRY